MPRNPPILPVINAGAVSKMVEFLQRHDEPKLQSEAAWVLVNITSSTYVQTVIAAGAVPLLINLLASSLHLDVRENVAHALGNIAGDSAQHRNLLLAAGVLPPLLVQLSIKPDAGAIPFTRAATFLLYVCLLSTLFDGWSN